MASLLTELLSRGFEDCQIAFRRLKALLTCTHILLAPNFALPFKLAVDPQVSCTAPRLYYWDRVTSLLKIKSAYSTIEKEALALVLALHVHVGSPSHPVQPTISTDHNPLVFLNRMFKQRLMRWSMT